MNLARFDPERELTWMIVAQKKPRHPYPRRHTCSFPALKQNTPGGPGSSLEESSAGLVRIACRTGGHVKLDVTGAAGSSTMMDWSHTMVWYCFLVA